MLRPEPVQHGICSVLGSEVHFEWQSVADSLYLACCQSLIYFESLFIAQTAGQACFDQARNGCLEKNNDAGLLHGAESFDAQALA